MKDRIVAVVVTYNRLNLLKECIGSLRRQTGGAPDIIVVNNGSTDGTAAWLQAQADIHVVSQDNLGGAGGFHRGMQEASGKGYEWMWIMDDDAFPEYQCLEKLQLALAAAPGTQVIAPLVLENGLNCTFHRGRIDSRHVGFPRIQEPVSNEAVRQADGGMLEVDFISFVGLMVHRTVIDLVGLPRADYYIFNDDVEYSLRIRKAGITMKLATNACIFHKVNEPGKAPDLVSATAVTEQAVTTGRWSKLQNRKQLYYAVDLFFCYLRRNSLINIGTYFELPRWKMYSLCCKDYVKSIARSGFSKGFFARSRLLMECYRQGLRQTTDNETMRRYAGKI